MDKGTLATLVVLAIVLLTVVIAVFDAYAQVNKLGYAAPLWLITLCSLTINAVIYAVFKAKEDQK